MKRWSYQSSENQGITKRLRSLAVVAAVSLFPLTASAQLSIKNNLLYDAALTPNLGLEWRLGDKWTMGVSAGFSPFELGTDTERRWRHLLVMPEVRYWFCERYSHHFLSVNAVYSHFNAAKLDLPLYGTGDYRYQGDLAGLGASWGYAIPIGKHNHWNIEFELGADLAYAWFNKYTCEHCGTPLGEDNKWLVLPKAGINLAWILPSRYFNEERAHACDDEELYDNIPWIAPEPFRPAYGYVEDNTGKAGELQRTNPVLEHISNYRPYDNTRVLRKEKGMLYVHFPLDKTTLLRDFRDNAPILDQIVDITRQILADTTSSVKIIQIIGMASIEGTVKHNCELGQGRAEALQKYIEERLPATQGLFELNNGCEAWAEFEDQVKDLRAAGGTESITTDDLDEVLNIIQTESDLNRREQKIRKVGGGRAYNYLRDNVLSDQRNSGYLRIYYDYVPDEEARIINAAVDLMKEERYEEALAMLQPVAYDHRSWNPLGVCLQMCERTEEALPYFRKAVADGNDDAVKNLKQLE